jgi:glyoxylase-like metal-dependent hydrolase (beta-lactamase superfamily II)
MATGITVRALVLSRFALDGGALHGIVPKPLWERVHPADAKNRVALVARALVVDDARAGARTLIELGMGQRWTDKERDIYALERGPEVPDLLAAAGIDPDTVTHVVLTHAHWDHAGGLVRQEGDRAVLALPRAEHVIGEACLAYSSATSEKDSGSFRPHDLTQLQREGKLRAWRQGEQLAPGIEGLLSNGHTEGLVVPLVRERDDGPAVALPTDLIPTRSHLKPHWVAAYDNHPARAIEEKRALIELLGSIGGGVVLYHDPEVDAAWTRRSATGYELVAGALASPPS